MARRRLELNIDPADLFTLSIPTLALAHSCSERHISDLREQARAQRDSVVAERIATRTQRTTARRAYKKRERAIAITTVIAAGIIPAVDHLEPTLPHHPAPPAILPTRPSTAVTPSNWNYAFESFKMLAALPQAVRFMLDGGTLEYLFHRNDHSELLVDLIGEDLQTWIVKFPAATITEESARTCFDELAAAPSTVAFALHPPDGAHSGAHLHVVSTKSDTVGLSILQRKLNACPVSFPVRDVVAMIQYLDIGTKANQYCVRYSQGGAVFGKAAPAEFRVVAGAMLLHNRVSQINLKHVMAIAKFLSDRSRTIAGVPTAWRQRVAELFAEYAHIAKRPHNDEAHVPDLFANVYLEAWIAWSATMSLVAVTTAPPAPWLAHAKYYRALTNIDHTRYSFETRWEYASRKARVIDIIRRQNAAQHVDSLEIICGYQTHPDYHAYLRSERFAATLLSMKLLVYSLPHLPVPMIDTVPLVPNPYAATNAALTCTPMPSMDELRQRLARA